MGLDGVVILIMLWLAMGILCIVQNQEQLERLTLGNIFIAFIIFIIFGPYFVIVNVLEAILLWLGWEDDNNDDAHGV
jgi:hypothetical protein